MNARFEGKTAIVTGAGHGIGAAIADRLAAEGAAVLVCDLDKSRADAKSAALIAKGARAEAVATDVRNRSSVEAAVNRAADAFGSLDIVVNVAGIMDRAPFLEMTDELWHRIIDINLYGTFLVSQVAARRMIAFGKGGVIVSTASNSGIFGGQGRTAYGASKAGVINLTQSMAIELAPYDIRVNAVAPGPTKTRAEQGATIGASVAARMPMKRFGKPEEIAALAAFLASDDASFTTGHTFAADGGFTISGMLEG